MIFKVQNFEYNGFYGQSKDGLADYYAEFIEWTSDPGVGRFRCSDGVERIIPTFALICTKKNNINHLPKQPKTGVMFGAPCSSK